MHRFRSILGHSSNHPVAAKDLDESRQIEKAGKGGLSASGFRLREPPQLAPAAKGVVQGVATVAISVEM